MHIKYSEIGYNGDENLREVLEVSGETLFGTNRIVVSEEMIQDEFDEKQNILYDIAQNKIISKSPEQRKNDILLVLQSTMLSRLKDITIAIAAQEATNKHLKNDGEGEIYTITKQEIKTIGKFQNKVTKFHQTWDEADYTLDSNGDLYLTSDSEVKNYHIFNGDIELPKIITRLF